MQKIKWFLRGETFLSRLSLIQTTMIYGESIGEVLLKALLYKTMRFKDVEKMVRGHSAHENAKTQSIRNTLDRLKKLGLVTRDETGWSGTNEAEIWLQGTEPVLRHLFRRTEKLRKKKKDLIIIFDIPEKQKRKRDWLRVELIAMGFEQMQKSVWFGPGPLPKEFVDRIKELELLEFTRFFWAKEAEIA